MLLRRVLRRCIRCIRSERDKTAERMHNRSLELVVVVMIFNKNSSLLPRKRNNNNNINSQQDKGGKTQRGHRRNAGEKTKKGKREGEKHRKKFSRIERDFSRQSFYSIGAFGPIAHKKNKKESSTQIRTVLEWSPSVVRGEE